MAVSVGVSADDDAPAATIRPSCARRSGPQSGPLRPDDVILLLREIRVAKSPSFRERGRCQDTVCAALTIGAQFGVRIRATIWITRDTPTITHSMLDLCSAPCKALRFAPPAHSRGLRALTMPAHRSRSGYYVMAERVLSQRNTLSQSARRGIGRPAGCRRTETHAATR